MKQIKCNKKAKNKIASDVGLKFKNHFTVESGQNLKIRRRIKRK